MANLFSLDKLAKFMGATLDDERAKIARDIATSAVNGYLRADATATGTGLTAYLPVGREGEVKLPGLLTGVTSIADASATGLPLPYTWRDGAATLRLGSYLGGCWYPVRHSDEVLLTYAYAAVPPAVRDAAMLTAADIYGPTGEADVAAGVQSRTEEVGMIRTTLTYFDPAADSAELEHLVPASARALLAPFRSVVRSVRLR